jgi:uncharacterized protein YfaS (alpha-2-macroglobulin family)
MNVAVTARSNGRVTLNVVGDRMLSSVTADVKPGTNQLAIPVGKDWGNGAYVVATLRRPLDARRRSACPAAPSACNGSRSTGRPARSAWT